MRSRGAVNRVDWVLRRKIGKSADRESFHAPGGAGFADITKRRSLMLLAKLPPAGPRQNGEPGNFTRPSAISPVKPWVIDRNLRAHIAIGDDARHSPL
jgi:hypothetical protein